MFLVKKKNTSEKTEKSHLQSAEGKELSTQTLLLKITFKN